ncbi:hypothetical protein [Acaryochloris sp. IP29b_bin.137]|uniref:hypothetical protein n=1 Tax=Acaryochloris sp. IP29b_bin.137 TaxID=2969217 RepID=UPI002628C343|nr:hypothetical protein [Acaryochloris sp. IP29b_bin.137]
MTSQFSLPQMLIPFFSINAVLRKSLIAALIGGMVLFSLPSPAEAAICRNIQGRRICEASLNRSAKNYWEYRAIVTIDGARQPRETYNCRDQIRIQADGTVIPFEKGDPSPVVCRLYNKRRAKRR